jgi:hypothetical protein
MNQIITWEHASAHLLHSAVLGVGVHIEGGDLATVAHGNVHEALANLARANDADSLAVQIETDQAIEREIAVADAVVSLMDSKGSVANLVLEVSEESEQRKEDVHGG